MVRPLPSTQKTRVRFPPPAPLLSRHPFDFGYLRWINALLSQDR
jgi:hypothetical protein